jgi:phage terminase large subunit
MQEVEFKLHKYQDIAFQALKDPAIREIGLIAGIQGGKSIWGALAFRHLIEKCEIGNANFVVGAPTYMIMEQATLPTFKKVFSGYVGNYQAGLRMFRLHKGGSVFFRTATDPDQAEGIPDCAAAWIDEAGKCGRLFKININGRVARLQGKTLYTSTPYALNWLYHEVIKPFKEKSRSDLCVVEFTSADNPSFPREEFERQRQLLDSRTFRRKYMGVHERMEGLVYECLTAANHVQSHQLPAGTRYFAGVDFGFAEGHEFAIIVRAVTPDGIHYDVSEFKQSGLSPNDQVQIARAKMQLFHVEHFACDPARPDLIAEFNKAGCPAFGFHTGKENMKGINAGIEKHVELIKLRRYRIFSDQCKHLIDEYETYKWPEDNEGQVKREIPVPINDHLMDATRYVTVSTSHLTAEIEKPRILNVRSFEVDGFNPTKVKKAKNWDTY